MPFSDDGNDSLELTNLFRRLSHFQITVPLDPFQVISTNRWQLCTYTVFSKILQMDCHSIKQNFSARAFSFYSRSTDTYFIVYNSDLPFSKVRYALAHEIGHIVCEHVSPQLPYQQFLDGKQNAINEIIADEFANFALKVDLR